MFGKNHILVQTDAARQMAEEKSLRDYRILPQQGVETVAYSPFPVASPYHKTYSAPPT
jgi:hypothetical protein